MSSWWPAGIFAVGIVLITAGIQPQRTVPLRAELGESVAREYLGWQGEDREVSAGERRIAGMDEYVMRIYAPAEAATDSAAALQAFSVYVGYYRHQAQGRTIHSPRNCLPGGGWEPLQPSRRTLETGLGSVPVNHVLIAKGQATAVVLYWYQGRGRVSANEYRVKWELLRDQALLGRSDEALVRVVVPVTTNAAEATARAERVARQLVVDVDRALPPRG